jgi:hypothetical protein
LELAPGPVQEADPEDDEDRDCDGDPPHSLSVRSASGEKSGGGR